MAEYSDASVIVTGGILRRNTLGGVGDVAVKALNGIRADIVFLATSGIAKDGLTYPSMDEVSVKQAMMRSAVVRKSGSSTLSSSTNTSTSPFAARIPESRA